MFQESEQRERQFGDEPEGSIGLRAFSPYQLDSASLCLKGRKKPAPDGQRCEAFVLERVNAVNVDKMEGPVVTRNVG